MLRQLPGLRMAGENHDTFRYLKDLINNVSNNKSFRHGGNAFVHNPIPSQTLSCVAQQMIEGIDPPLLDGNGRVIDPDLASRDVVGFKTVTFAHHINTPGNRTDTIRFLRTNFPCARFIVNINTDIEQRANSTKNNFRLHKNLTAIELNEVYENGNYTAFAELLGPDRAFLVDKAEWTRNISKLNEAVSWMGYDRACHFTELLQLNMGGYSTVKTELPPFPPECRRL